MVLEVYFYDIANTMETNTPNSQFHRPPIVLGMIDDLDS